MTQPIYLLGDQPMCCPVCGTRTTFEVLPDETQVHDCSNCDYTFIAMEDLSQPTTIEHE